MIHEELGPVSEFHFEKAAPDFTDKSTKPFVVHMNSKAFGKSNTFKIGLE